MHEGTSMLLLLLLLVLELLLVLQMLVIGSSCASSRVDSIAAARAPASGQGVMNSELGVVISSAGMRAEDAGPDIERTARGGAGHMIVRSSRRKDDHGSMMANATMMKGRRRPTMADIATTRGPARSLLPTGRVVKDEVGSHVVRIRSQSNGEGTGLLLKKNFVLTAKRVVGRYLDPFEIRVELGGRDSTHTMVANGLEVWEHPHQDLAVVKIHPPLEGTGRAPGRAGAPKGFFWPVAARDPSRGARLRVYGYGGGKQLRSGTFHVAGVDSRHRVFLTASPPSTRLPATSADSGGPAFSASGATLEAVISRSTSPRHATLVGLAHARDWILDSMRSLCSREEQAFVRLLVGADPDVLIYYHCRVDRAEHLNLYLLSKPGRFCSPAWKAVRLVDPQGRLLAALVARDSTDKDFVTLTRTSLKSTTHFYLELWKANLHGLHTKVVTYGPFSVDHYMDGGLHFEWCAS